MVKGKKIISIIEARMSSTRLPGKVMLPICGKPMLQVLIEQVKRSKKIDKVVLATTTNNEDNALVDLAKKLNIGWFRGSEDDVLRRVLFAAKKYQADVIVELCGDNPLLDPEIIDKAVALYFSSKADVVSTNIVKIKFPIDQSVKVFSTQSLEFVNKISDDPIDHEHVSIYFFEHPNQFKITELIPEKRQNKPKIRLTIDTQRDLELVRRICHLLSAKKNPIHLSDTISIIDQFPNLLEINSQIKQKKARYVKQDLAKIEQAIKQEKYSYKPKYKSVIVGCGKIAGLFDDDPKRDYVATHAGAYQTHPQVQLAAICDINQSAVNYFAKRWDVERMYSDYKKMFKEVKPDIASICVTPEYHCKVLREAIRSKIKYIICEKPFGVSVKEAQDCISAAKKSKVILTVHYNRRFEPKHRNLMSQVERGIFGEMKGGIMYYSNGFLNNGCYLANLVMMFCGQVKTVQTVGVTRLPGALNLDVVLTLSGNRTVFLKSVSGENYVFEADLLFEKARIKLENLGTRMLIISSTPSPLASNIRVYEGRKKSIMAVPQRSLPLVIKHLLKLKSADNLWSTADQAMLTLEILTAAFVSLNRKGNLVNLPLPLKDRKYRLKEMVISK